MLDEWCENECVPGPSEETQGHRDRNQPRFEFGLVNKPVAAGSAQWKSVEGKTALDEEAKKHEKKGTWNLKKVVELKELLRETRETGEEVILGGVHPVM